MERERGAEGTDEKLGKGEYLRVSRALQAHLLLNYPKNLSAQKTCLSLVRGPCEAHSGDWPPKWLPPENREIKTGFLTFL